MHVHCKKLQRKKIEKITSFIDSEGKNLTLGEKNPITSNARNMKKKGEVLCGSEETLHHYRDRENKTILR